MNSLLYLSKGELFCTQEHSTFVVECQAIEQYKTNLQEIRQRKEWKTQGSGAMFMGTATYDNNTGDEGIFPAAAVMSEDNHIIYCACLQNGTAIYSKSLIDPRKQEGLVLRKNDLSVYDMDYDSANNRLAISASTQGYERHLAILPLEDANIHFLTEGDCHDSNPSFDPNHSEILYYDSCGFAYNQQENLVGLGPKGICRLNLKTGELKTIMENQHYDFFNPKMDKEGNLYCIQRPYKTFHEAFSFKELLLAPVKILRAIIGWLDFFTQRYTGESLRSTTGSNPAKMKQKSDEELFIEGNLVNVKRALAENQKSGDKYPGIVPQSWTLIKMTPDGTISTLKKGVLSYALRADGVLFYANGRHLVEHTPECAEKSLYEGTLITKIIC